MSKRLLVEQKHTKAGIEFIKEGLEEFGIEKKQTIKTMLLVEEVLVKLREHAKDPDEKICIILNKRFGRVYVNLSLRGEKFQFIYGHTIEEVLDQENDDLQSAQEKEEKIIRDVLLKANEERLRYKNKNNMNLVEITVQKKSPCHGITYNAGFNSCNRNRCIDESVCTFRRERSTEQYYFYIYQHNVPECFEDDCRPGSIFLHSMLHFPIWRSERSRTYWWKNHGLLPAYHGSGNSYGNRCV